MSQTDSLRATVRLDFLWARKTRMTATTFHTGIYIANGRPASLPDARFFSIQLARHHPRRVTDPAIDSCEQIKAVSTVNVQSLRGRQQFPFAFRQT